MEAVGKMPNLNALGLARTRVGDKGSNHCPHSLGDQQKIRGALDVPKLTRVRHAVEPTTQFVGVTGWADSSPEEWVIDT